MTEQSAGTGKVLIRHERVEGYRSEFISGLSAAGPLNDGLLRLTLFRDAIPPVVESFDPDPNIPGAIDPKSAATLEVSIVREDVVTLIVTPKMAAKLGRDLRAIAEPHLTAASGQNVSET